MPKSLKKTGYRIKVADQPETVQDLELSAVRRLDEAVVLYLNGCNHTAIYLAGLAAEMYLKTACFFLGGAKPADPVFGCLAPLRARNYKPPFKEYFEAGHGLWFWSQELADRRKKLRKRSAPNRFLQVISGLYMDWYIGMRYRPGVANATDAARFITQVEWIANNHGALRS